MLPVHPHAVREGLEHGALGGGERRLHLTAQAVHVAPPVEEGARRQAGDGARHHAPLVEGADVRRGVDARWLREREGVHAAQHTIEHGVLHEPAMVGTAMKVQPW